MGWLQGVLSGYAKRHYEIEDTKRKEAGVAADREGRVFETLLNSPYRDIQDYALAGILDLSNPRRRKGGVAGWMGEVETTPYLDMIKRTQQRINEDPEYARANVRRTYEPWLGDDTTPPIEQGGTPPPTPSVTTPSGSVAPAQAGTPPAALPSTSKVTGTPGTAPTPAPPPPTPPPSLNFSDYIQNGKPVPQPPAQPPPTPPGGAVGPGLTGRVTPQGTLTEEGKRAMGVEGGDPGMALTDEQLRQIGGTPGAVDPGFVRQAPPGSPPVPPGGPAPLPPTPVPTPAMAAPPPEPPSQPGLVAPGMPGATTQTVGPPPVIRTPRTQLPSIVPTTADLHREQARAAVTGKIEAYAEMYRAQGIPEQEAYSKAAKLFEQDLLNTGAGGIGQTYTPGPIAPDPTSPTGYSQTLWHKTDPTRQMKIPSQAPAGRNTLIASYQRQWNAIQAPVRAMEINLRTMVSSYNRYMAGDETAWEPLRTAFVHVSEPNSVVMPSEFMRAAGVLGLRDRLWGWLEQKRVGGGVLDKNEVRNTMATALAIWEGASTYGAQQRSAIEAAIDRPDLQIPHEAVFGSLDRYNPQVDTSESAGPGPEGTAKNPTPAKPATPAGGSFHLDNGKWVWR